MRRIVLIIVLAVLVLLFLGVSLVSCKQDNITGSVVGLPELDNLQENELPIPIAKKVETKELPKETIVTDEELLKQFENRQKDVFVERGAVLVQKRDLYDKINLEAETFEEKQFYQKALDIVRERETKLNAEITYLESKILSLRTKLESGDLREAYQNQLENLYQDKEEYLQDLKETGYKIIEAREVWMATLNDTDRSTLKSLESEENKILSSLSNIKKEIKDKEEYVEKVLEAEFPETFGSLLVERYSLLEQLSSVQNELVQAYIAAKDLVGKELKEAEDRIKDLKDKEEKLDDELIEVETKINEN